jgi:hypothetical protein
MCLYEMLLPIFSRAKLFTTSLPQTFILENKTEYLYNNTGRALAKVALGGFVSL